jgi:hypothetical protein
MSGPPGRAPYWWENLLQVVPRIVKIKGAMVLVWLGGIYVLRRPK